MNNWLLEQWRKEKKIRELNISSLELIEKNYPIAKDYFESKKNKIEIFRPLFKKLSEKKSREIRKDIEFMKYQIKIYEDVFNDLGRIADQKVQLILKFLILLRRDVDWEIAVSCGSKATIRWVAEHAWSERLRRKAEEKLRPKPGITKRLLKFFFRF